MVSWNCPSSRSEGTAYQTGVWVHLIVAGPQVEMPDRTVPHMVNEQDNNNSDNPARHSLYPGPSLFGIASQFRGSRLVTVALNTSVEVLRLNNNDSALVSDSILWQPEDILVGIDNTGSQNGDCNNGSETTSFTGAVRHYPIFIVQGTPINPRF